MAKRTLGLAKAAKAKKQKKEQEHQEISASPDEESSSSNQLTIELPEEIDANDEISQLKGLHKTYLQSERDNELLVNGIIHECDRLLRENDSENKQPLPAVFHAIYAIALAELSKFHTEELDKVKEFFIAALERVELGLEKNPNDINLLVAKTKILLDQISLQYIAPLTLESDVKELDKEIDELLDAALSVYESVEARAKELKDYSIFDDSETLDILEALDDILDIVDNFGKENQEEKSVELAETHPLYKIKNSDKYDQWWRDHTHLYLDNLEKLENGSPELKREVCHRLGQSYLRESEVPYSVFTTLKYDMKKEAQKISQELITKALDYLKQAKDEEDPETWVSIAEAMISLGNLYEVDSKEQEDLYLEAEKILKGQIMSPMENSKKN
ncbi:Nuclear pore complex subunit Nro1 family protein [Candida albicans]|uniref:Enhancer of translation termination 1 n=1 Tax=Candida albicans TaxID=5476 RepID=A0A8H6BUB3_CANAX|nr:Nuclear pore complex subunit Nro1 family protein [Candida albicans]